jgi:hypothetical protein
MFSAMLDLTKHLTFHMLLKSLASNLGIYPLLVIDRIGNDSINETECIIMKLLLSAHKK